MRQVLVNHANASLADKRSGGQAKVSFEEVDPAVQMEAKDVLALNAVLRALQIVDPRKSRVVELRYFGGLSIEETAQALTLHRIVALKVIKAGMISDQVLRRFEQECEALGRLHHPGIAQIYDAGTADSGFGPQPISPWSSLRAAP
jgi:serine/threonine protein kinase